MDSKPPASVLRTIVWHVVNAPGNRAIASQFIWDESDPCAVKAVFHEGGEGNEDRVWLFARALLVEAMTYGMSGEGDVTAIRGVETFGLSGRMILQQTKTGKRLWMFLTSPDGTVCIAADSGDVAAFLSPTLHAVPIGFESFDHLEQEIADLLGTTE
jgi:hypothetical protein